MYVTYTLISHNRISWLCLLAFGYTAVTLWSIHGDLPPALDRNAKAEWQQPIAANTLFPNPISRQQWHFDYEVTEHILGLVKLNSSGEPLLNPELAMSLAKATASLPQNMNEKTLQRIAFLISKSLPHTPNKGEVLAALLINYYHLQSATNKVNAIAEAPLSTTEKLTDFLQEEARQNHYLGEEVATQLFGAQRNITRYLLERKVIKENVDLSPQQKNQQLDALPKPLIRR
jgi:4-amino-4-deoxy-L-arabinose transferase-like glycosyltransferase